MANTITNLSTLNINRLTKDQYQAARNAGTLNQNEFYMVPDSEDRGPTEVTQAEYDALEAVGELDPYTFYYITDGIPSNKEYGYDDTLSTVSENAVKNKVITSKINELQNLLSSFVDDLSASPTTTYSSTKLLRVLDEYQQSINDSVGTSLQEVRTEMAALPRIYTETREPSAEDGKDGDI